MIKNILLTIAKSVIAITLAMSGYVHIDNNFYFLSTIYSYQIVSETTGMILATILPPLQLLIAIGLLFDTRGTKKIFLLASFLFFVFSIAQISAWYRDLNISCGCFGSTLDNPIGAQSISLAIGGCVISLVGAFLSRKNCAEIKPPA